NEPFLFSLVPIVVNQIGDAFPELKAKGQTTAEVIRKEEKDFFRTIKKGVVLFQSAAEEAKKTGSNVIDGETAADLYTTHGFPVDLTEQMAVEKGLTVDRAGYDRAMEKHRGESEGDGTGFVVSAVQGELPKTDDSAKYQSAPVQAKVLGWVKDNA